MKEARASSTRRVSPALRARSFLAAIAFLAACASGPRATLRDALDARDPAEALGLYERLRANEGPDISLLRDVAREVLRAALDHDDPNVRRSALAQLAGAGPRGTSVLAEAAREAPRPFVRARALQVLAARGDRLARAELRAYATHEDPEVRAASIGAFDPTQPGDRAELLRRARSEHPSVRREVARRLRLAPPSAQTLATLRDLAHHDRFVGVRVAAVASSSAQGPDALSALISRATDPDAAVRGAALRSLSRLEAPEATAHLLDYLAMPPGRESLEAARLLAARPNSESDPAPHATAAGRYLAAGLAAPAADLRAQAAVGLSSLPDVGPHVASVVATLEVEADPRVRRILADVLLRSTEHRERGADILRELLAGEGVPALIAASRLSRIGDEVAIERLRVALVSSDPAERCIAAPGLARDAGHRDEARHALGDPDGHVRVFAAGAILSGD